MGVLRSVVEGRRGGERVEVSVKALVALRLQQRPHERQTSVAQTYGVSQSLVSGVLKRMTAHCRAVGAVAVGEVVKRGERAHLQRVTWTPAVLWPLLREKKRGGGAQRRKLHAEHQQFMREVLAREPCVQHAQLAEALWLRFRVRVHASSVARHLRALGYTRKRVQRLLPRAALTDKNLHWRRRFVRRWFRSCDVRKVGTAAEFDDQRRWRLRTTAQVRSNAQLFFVDETGCNRHTLRATYGYAARGQPARKVGDDGARGYNHSVLIAVSSSAVLAHTVLHGDVKSKSKRKRGTKRVDFCRFLRRQVAPAMLASAAAAGVAQCAPLYLVMDNASIHKGVVVSQALRSVSPRLHVVYQPPYMPTVHPTELVNSKLKQLLKRASVSLEAAALLEPQHHQQNQTVDPSGGVVNQSPTRFLQTIFVEQGLSAAISHVLDTCFVSQDLKGYYKHCGWH